jgi:hypothetical protein
MRKLFGILGGLALLTSTAAMAADMPVKAPPLNPIYTGYPYGSSGLFYGAYAEGGGGPVNGTGVNTTTGVSTAGLVELQAGFGLTVGYAWGTPTSNVAYSVEGDIGMTNFNGSTQGFSAGGPLEGEFRFVAFTPLANITQYIPGFASLGTLPPFNAIPAGVTASHTQLGIMAGMHWNDISLDFQGLSSNKEFRAAPMIGLVQMEQLSNGLALRTYVKTIFPSQSLTVGPVPTKQANGGLGQQVIAGASLFF